jgi:predicted flavoprotein YhiN
MLTAKFSIKIAPEEIKKYYQGSAQSVIARASNGLKIQFPASLLLPYVTHNGISGQFVLTYHKNGKAESLSRV